MSLAKIAIFYTEIFVKVNLPRSGTDVMILKIFLPKKSAKKFAFLTQNKGKLCKFFNHNIGF
jgi:hypothetical protein